MNKWKILVVVFLALAMKTKAAPGKTNTTYSATNIDYMLSTNRSYVSNSVWTNVTAFSASNTTYAVSNLQYLTFSNTVSTNFAVLTPGSNTFWLKITNGFTRGVTNAAP